MTLLGEMRAGLAELFATLGVPASISHVTKGEFNKRLGTRGEDTKSTINVTVLHDTVEVIAEDGARWQKHTFTTVDHINQGDVIEIGNEQFQITKVMPNIFQGEIISWLSEAKA